MAANIPNSTSRRLQACPGGRCLAQLALGAALFLAAGSVLAATYFSRQTGDWNVNTTWSTAACGGAAAAAAPGAGDDIQICNLAAAHTVTVTASTSAASLTMNGGNQAATLTINGGQILTVNGDATMNAPTTGNDKTISLLANAALIVNGNLTLTGGGAGQLAQLLLASNAGTLVTVTGNLAGTVAGGAFNARATITFAGLGTIQIGGNFAAGATLTSATGTIEFNGGGAQSIPVYNTAGATNNYNHITINKAAGTATLAGNILVRGNFTNNAAGTFSAGACASSFTVTFQGAAAQSLLGTAAGTSFCRVTLNNAADLTLQHNLNIENHANGLLTLTAGEIITGANRVYIANGSNIASAGSGGSDFVVGNLTKPIPITGGTVGRVFEVGTQAGGNRYAPANLAFSAVTVGGDITVSTSAGSHPSLGSSGLDTVTPHKLNRWWTVTNGGAGLATATFSLYGGTFTFVAADVDATANPRAFIATRFAAGVWNPVNVVTASPITISFNNETGFGDFAVGEVLGYNATLGRFNAYDPPPVTFADSVHGNIRTKVAGTGFSVTIVHLTAAGTALSNHTGVVTVDLMDGSDSSGAFANNCSATWKVIRSVTVDFGGGGGTNQQTADFTGGSIETNAWRDVRIRASGGGQTGCSGDRFAIRPSGLSVLARDATWTTPGNARTLNNTATTGGTVHKAGQPFRLEVTAEPAGATQYDGEPTVKTSACQVLAGMGACTNGTLTVPAGVNWTGAGTRVNDAVTYSEVGAFQLELEDPTYASVDTADTTPAVRTIPQTTPAPPSSVGRFVPDRFVVAAINTPQFRTFGAACAAARSFTYIGQSFDYVTTPTALVTAQNASGATTANYRDTLWKIGVGAPSVAKDCTTDLNICQFTTSFATSGRVIESYSYALTPASTPNWDNSATTGVVASVASSNNGTGTVSFATSNRLAFLRNTAAPQSPFTAAITNTLSAQDNSEADGTIGTTSSAVFNGGGTGIAFDGGDFSPGAAGKTFLYGRLRASNANGSQLLPLLVPLEAQYWNGNSFITNVADSCTTFAVADVAMSGFGGNLAACETATSASGALAGGRRNLSLAAPGQPNDGRVDLTVNLGAAAGTTCTAVGGATVPATGANRLYLQGNWTGGAFTQNPTARATFGVFKGAEEVIFIREKF